MKTQIDMALNEPIYDCTNTIAVLKQIPEFCHAYSLLNSKKRSYTLEEHTIMVCRMFETLFLPDYAISEFELSSFRLLLCLHDIGKPFSILDNNKAKQSEYTIRLIEKKRDFLPFSEKDYAIATALISDDPLGFYIRGKIELIETVSRIQAMVKKSELRIDTLFCLLTIYYQVDSGAYTRQFYIGPLEDFIEKPKLEAVFAKDRDGKLIYLPQKHRLAFSDNIEEKINCLMDKLEINYG